MAVTKRSRQLGAGLFGADPPPTPARGSFARVALDRPMREAFSYRVPDDLVGRVAVGARVVVPFGAEREVGVVVALEDETSLERVRAVERVLDEHPLLSRPLLELARRIADEYACAWGEALAAMLPAALKSDHRRARVSRIRAVGAVAPDVLAELERRHPKQHRLMRTLIALGGPIDLRDLLRQLNLSDAPARSLARRGLVAIELVEASRDPFDTASSDRARPKELSPAQRVAVDALVAAIDGRRTRGFLLEGVTGSGKTEVYLAAIEHALARGLGAIALVPEIALTPQTVGWFRSRFERIAVLHSRMSDLERLDAWTSIARGEAKVVVGARSAIFAPVVDLGVIVVDEEHEPSFKQGGAPRYHARDVARMRAELEGAVFVLGSATPSLESVVAAREGELEHLRLPHRASGKPLPPVEVVDLRSERVASTPSRLFSQPLVDAVRATLARREQSILFLNRRGFAPVLWCPGCKQTARCKRCDVALVFHQRIRRLVCHLCCEEGEAPKSCPICTKPGLRYLSAGSERVESELATLAPTARVLRMDSDTMRRREDYETALAAFGRGDVDVLIGTQMIAKGLDFPRVTLVGIVNADGALHLPDFRASERTFQLIAQVAGRAGRGELAGRILVQTYAPDHPAIVCASRHDFTAFAAAECALRAELGYPPYGRLVRVLLEDPSELKCARAAEELAAALRERIFRPSVAILGPAPAPIAMIRGRFRRHVLIKAPRGEDFDHARAAAVAVSSDAPEPKPMVDVDPVSML